MTTLTSESRSLVPATARALPALRNLWLVLAALAFTGLGLAAGIAWKPERAEPAQLASLPPTSAISPTASLAPNESLVDPVRVPAADPKPQGALVPTAPVAEAPKPAKAPARQPARQVASNSSRTAAAVCKTCGVVESVREVTVKGQGTGLGAIAGGVVGGAVGNQVGKGNGRKAMTVLGAIGGGFAGHEIEKHARRTTHYDVTVRMDDGSTRTIRQQSAPASGSRVRVEGGSLRVTRAPASSQA